jgi:predicted phosphate transport protein (TIGR00153 family)
MAKKHNLYFEYFLKMVELSCNAAEHLVTFLSDYSLQKLPEQREAMHKIERAEDEIKHEMMKQLAKEFVTPIDREDIIQLANMLDDVTDKIDDLFIRLYMYNIASIRPEMQTFAGMIQRWCEALRIAVREFPNFHKSNSLLPAVVDVNSLEEEGDKIYIEAVHRLYEPDSALSPLDTMAWSVIFDGLEDCCDTCEHVADLLQTVVMKNS